MLKDITLGQFFPGNTIVHRLDPRTKILAVVLYIVALFSANSVLTYAIVMVALTVSILVSKVPFRSLTKDEADEIEGVEAPGRRIHRPPPTQ